MMERMELQYTLSPSQIEKEFKLSNRSKLNVLRTVYEGLDARRRQLLKGGCFKHLFSIPKLEVSGTIIHHLIMRTSKKVSDEECWFIIGGQSLRFGVTEFAVITGLKIGNVDKCVDESVGINSPLVKKYFRGSKKVYRKDVLKKISCCSNRLDKYKLGLILILAYVVIGLDDVKAISLWWFDLVDDLKIFNNYPWGNLSYKMTTEVLHRDLSIPFNNKKVAYVVHGFPLSFMVWAFESIPLIAKYATKLDCEKFPRMMNWELTKQRFKSSEIQEALESKETVLISELMITEAERTCIYGDVDIYDDETEKKEPEEKVDKKILKILEQFEREVDAFMESASNSEKAEVVEILHRLERKICVDGVLSGLEDKNENEFEESNIFERAEMAEIEGENANAKAGVEVEEVAMAEIEENNVNDKAGAERKKRGKRKLENVEVEEVAKAEIKENNVLGKAAGERKKRGKRKLESVEVVGVERVERKERTKGRKRVDDEYDPMYEIDHAKMDCLDKWLVTKALVRHEVRVLRDRVLDSDELKKLLTTGWMSGSIMEAGLEILRDRMREHPRRFQIGACIMDPWFSQYVKRAYKNSTNYKSIENIKIDPACFLSGQSWFEARHIYFVVCSDSSHWFACKVDVTEQCIYVYDSLPRHIRKAEFDKIMKPFLVMIPVIYSNVVEGAKLTLTVQKLTGLVVQDNGNDCGLYALKFIEFLAGKQDVGRLKSVDMQQYRKNLVAELVSQHAL